MHSLFRMRSVLFLSPVLLLAVGCNDLVPGTDENLATRYQAASEITNPKLADAKLAKVAGDAALVGNDQISNSAVNSIQDTSLRNKTAYQSAVWLARNGNRNAAIAMSEKITDGHMRDDLLNKLSNPLAP